MRFGIFLAGAVLTSVFFINFCDLVYRCGCESLWAAAARHCNIHDPGSRHCPWCSIGTVGGVAVWGMIVASQAAAAFAGAYGWIPRILLTLSAFPIAGAVLALAIGWMQGYWA